MKKIKDNFSNRIDSLIEKKKIQIKKLSHLNSKYNNILISRDFTISFIHS